MSAQLVHTIAGVREAVARLRGPGRTIGLVPTMGALHAGHGRLIETARAECGAVAVLSLFEKRYRYAALLEFAFRYFNLLRPLSAFPAGLRVGNQYSLGYML